MVTCKSSAKEVSFEWLLHRISSTDLKVRTTLHVSIIYRSGRERVKEIKKFFRLKRRKTSTLASFFWGFTFYLSIFKFDMESEGPHISAAPYRNSKTWVNFFLKEMSEF